ncbi:glycosyltransferase family 4 protein [Zhihengliuella halotolerans]|uniref:D-inositol 3-phosphate glycosyltransferase n=1 Tax=Zhihengliuella halotolerans TaxID=370736 RepID=A0A4Q8ACV2_9MICC|nr:glycosyltransferase family 4 protein [Zhihengliuella halotolerans]RZU61571.1 glycosyltransferase involved in cell wall biosynthesis [Zhihengliuella halotolerans]
MKGLLAKRHTLRRHWREDPVAFVERLWRRRSSPVAERGLRILDAGLGAVPSLTASSMAALLIGDSDEINFRLRSALARGPRGNRARSLANIALAADLPQVAAVFAARMDDADGMEVTRAKLDFYNGHTSSAIHRLDPSSARQGRLRDRYEAERDVFGEWVPRVGSVEGYEPQEQVVLHLLTNSLPYTTSGYTQRSHSMLRAQADEGWQVHAVTRLGYPESLGFSHAPKRQRIDDVVYHRLLVRGTIPNLRERLQLEADRLLELVLKVRPAVLHTTTHFVNGLVVRAVAKAVGIPWVYEVRGQLSDTWASKRGPEASNSERYQHFNLREGEVMRDADLVLTLGTSMRQRIEAQGVPLGRIRLTPNAVGSAFLETPQPSREVKPRLGLDPGKVHIGTVSSLVGYEGIDDLLTAYSILKDRGVDVELVIVGSGSSLKSLRVHAAQIGLDPERIFVGRVPVAEAVRYHRALDIFVVPRKDFAVTRSVTPLKPVEAMASCRPVIASDLPALREMVEHGKTGYCVPAEDPEALADAIESLVEDSALRERMGFSGREFVLATRTWKRNAEISLEIYDGLTRAKEAR